MAGSAPNSQHDNRSDDRDAEARDAARSGNSSHPVVTWGGQVVANFYQSVKADRTLPAIAREAMKDVRGTMHQVFFGQQEHGTELGAPLNPLASEISNDNSIQPGVHGAMMAQEGMGGRSGNGQTIGPSPPSPSQIAGGIHGPQSSADKGQEVQHAAKGWVDYILNRGKDETPYNPDKQHIKPEDEKEQQKEPEKEKEKDKDNDRDNDGRGGWGGGGRC